MDVATRSADWLGGIVDLMSEPRAAMPVPLLLPMLRDAFGVTYLGWNWFDADGSFGMVMDPPEKPAQERETLDIWITGQLFAAHAILHWIRVTGDLRPQTIARVPTRILDRRRREPLQRLMSGMGMEHQLSVPYRRHGPSLRSFVLCRSRADFSDDDLAVARVVQRSLRSLDHQTAVVRRLTGASVGADLGLTGRQLAVLQLIAEGSSTRHASRALACSPRTIEKHLENAYRTLGVRDRINAVRLLRAAGVVGGSPTAVGHSVTWAGTYRCAAPLVRSPTAPAAWRRPITRRRSPRSRPAAPGPTGRARPSR